MNAVDVIRAKRDGETLTAEQIEWFVAGYTDGSVADEQAAALLMAIVFQGLDPAELESWTAAMIDSGERLDLSSVDRPTVSKHSTGGVGDKTSIALVPLVAACGVAVPKLSGRGLGHTGGTLDKMESIAGWRADLHADEILAILTDPEIGAVIAAAGEDLAPADKRLYALRDITATVQSIPLIASSIMSKKIAEGADALVLDVKTGSGAFMPDLAQATDLARTMVELGTAHGLRTAAVLTDMDQPLGRAAGNALEVAEATELLRGDGPPDAREVVLALARQVLEQAGIDADPAEALADGRALERWRRMIVAQGGDPDQPLPVAAERDLVTAAESGVIRRLDALAVGRAAWRLGAGRAHKEDPVSATAGVVCLAKVGDRVRAGDPLLELHTDVPARFAEARAALEGAIEVGADPAPERPLVVEVITA